MNQEQKCMEIDVESLAKILAEEALREETKSLPEEDVWEWTRDDISLPLTKQVRAHWAYEYFMLVDKYTQLIESCKK